MRFRRRRHHDRLTEQREQRIPTMALVNLMGQSGMVRRVQEVFPSACVIEVTQFTEDDVEAKKATWDLLATIIPKELPLVERYERGLEILTDSLARAEWRVQGSKEIEAQVERRLQAMIHELERRIAHDRAKENAGTPADNSQES